MSVSGEKNWDDTNEEKEKFNVTTSMEISSSQASSETTTNLFVFKCNYCDKDRDVELVQLHASMSSINEKCDRIYF